MKHTLRVSFLLLLLISTAIPSFAALEPYITIKGGNVKKQVVLAPDGTFTVPALPSGDYVLTLFLGKKGYDYYKANVARIKVQFHWDRSSRAGDARKAPTWSPSSGGDAPMESVSRQAKPTELLNSDDIAPNEKGEISLGPVHIDGDGKSDFVGTVQLVSKNPKKHIAGVKYED